MKQEKNFISTTIILIILGSFVMVNLILYFSTDHFAMSLGAWASFIMPFAIIIFLLYAIRHIVEIDSYSIHVGYNFFKWKLYRKQYPLEEINNIQFYQKSFVGSFLGYGYRIGMGKLGYIAPDMEGTIKFIHKNEDIYISVDNVQEIKRKINGTL